MSKVFIIAGHGNGDSGAVGGGFQEADLVRRLASRMRAIGGDAVQVGDTSRNWYAENLISKGWCPKGVPVIELHMDSGPAGARGGHVIIKQGYEPDAIDTAIESFIKGFFPGRSITMSRRGDLANPNRAAAMGVNYRLVECGFISDSQDRGKFLSQMDDLARGILSAFGIEEVADVPAPMPEVVPELPEALRGYVDVGPGYWYIDALAEAVEAGIISGYGDGRLDPDGPVTRGQACCMIARAEGAEFEHPYSDVVASPYYYDAVAWAKGAGVVSSAAEEFRPDDPCTRAELCAMLYNLSGSPEAEEPDGVSDWEDVPEWARGAVAWAVESGVMSGSGGVIRADDACTRAEAAVIVMRFEEE